MTIYINIAKDFSDMPIGRYRKEGNKTGQAFREDILYPKICKALNNNDTLEVDFTGVLNLSCGFLEEAFGGLVREHGMDNQEVANVLKLTANNNHMGLYIDLAKQYIDEAVAANKNDTSRTV